MTIRATDKIVINIIMWIVLLFTFTALTTSCNKSEKTAGPKDKATIGSSQSQISLPIIIAQEKGYFSAEGLDVILKPYPSGKKAMEGLFKGEADIVAAAETPILFNSLSRSDFVVFATIAYSYDDNKVLGRKDKGVSRPSDLKGKKIGLMLGTSSHFFSHVYLAEHGIDLSAVTIVDIAPADMPGALKDGRVDAIIAWEPVAYQVRQALPDKIVRLPKTNLCKETFNLSTMSNYASAHPGVLKKTLKAIDRAISFIKQNKKESIVIMDKVLKLDEGVLTSTWDDFVYELSMEDSLLVVLEDEARWAITNRLTEKTKVPNYLGYVYLDAMKAIKPDAVTIIK
jgi:NitT/TauT family transport system substrate-binding protein